MYGNSFETNSVDALLAGRYYPEHGGVRAHLELTSLTNGELLGATDPNSPGLAIIKIRRGRGSEGENRRRARPSASRPTAGHPSGIMETERVHDRFRYLGGDTPTHSLNFRLEWNSLVNPPFREIRADEIAEGQLVGLDQSPIVPSSACRLHEGGKLAVDVFQASTDPLFHAVHGG